MQYGAIALAALGFAIGLMFRLKAFIPIVALVLSASIVFAVISEMTFFDAALTAFVAQTILQGSYFIGAITRGLFSNRPNSPVL